MFDLVVKRLLLLRRYGEGRIVEAARNRQALLTWETEQQ